LGGPRSAAQSTTLNGRRRREARARHPWTPGISTTPRPDDHPLERRKQGIRAVFRQRRRA
jgi:hypothetical protein